MKFLDDIISKFDALVLRSLSATELRERDEEFRKDANNYGDALTRSVYEAYDSIDTKATAILQHVSIMIAVTGILYSQTTGTFFKSLFGIETLLYVILALFCLRLFMMQHHSGQFSDTQNVAAREAILDIVAKFTFLVSIVLVGTILLELVLR